MLAHKHMLFIQGNMGFMIKYFTTENVTKTNVRPISLYQEFFHLNINWCKNHYDSNFIDF